MSVGLPRAWFRSSSTKCFTKLRLRSGAFGSARFSQVSDYRSRTVSLPKERSYLWLRLAKVARWGWARAVARQ